MIQSVRSKYGSRANAPIKDKWVFDKEWTDVEYDKLPEGLDEAMDVKTVSRRELISSLRSTAFPRFSEFQYSTFTVDSSRVWITGNEIEFIINIKYSAAYDDENWKSRDNSTQQLQSRFISHFLHDVHPSLELSHMKVNYPIKLGRDVGRNTGAITTIDVTAVMSDKYSKDSKGNLVKYKIEQIEFEIAESIIDYALGFILGKSIWDFADQMIKVRLIKQIINNDHEHHEDTIDVSFIGSRIIIKIKPVSNDKWWITDSNDRKMFISRVLYKVGIINHRLIKFETENDLVIITIII